MTEADLLSFVAIAHDFFLPLPGNACIARTRALTECLRRLAVSARPMPVQFAVTANSVELAYASGIPAVQRAALKQRVKSWVESEREHEQTWDGHVIVIVENRWLVDPSFDDAFRALHAMNPAVPESVGPFVLPLGDLDMELSDTFAADVEISTDDGSMQFRVQYVGSGDQSFLEASAWDLDYLEQAIEEICRRFRFHYEQRPL